jgi:hypothetical protein
VLPLKAVTIELCILWRHSIVEHARLDVLMNVFPFEYLHFLHNQVVGLVFVSLYLLYLVFSVTLRYSLL